MYGEVKKDKLLWPTHWSDLGLTEEEMEAAGNTFLNPTGRVLAVMGKINPRTYQMDPALILIELE